MKLIFLFIRHAIVLLRYKTTGRKVDLIIKLQLIWPLIQMNWVFSLATRFETAIKAIKY